MENLNLSGNEKISSFPEKFNKLVKITRFLVNTVVLLFVLFIFLFAQILFGKQINNLIGVSNDVVKYFLLLILIPIVVNVITNIINKKYIDPLMDK